MAKAVLTSHGKDVVSLVVFSEDDAHKVGKLIADGYTLLSAAGCARFLVYILSKNK